MELNGRDVVPTPQPHCSPFVLQKIRESKSDDASCRISPEGAARAARQRTHSLQWQRKQRYGNRKQRETNLAGRRGGAVGGCPCDNVTRAIRIQHDRSGWSCQAFHQAGSSPSFASHGVKRTNRSVVCPTLQATCQMVVGIRRGIRIKATSASFQRKDALEEFLGSGRFLRQLHMAKTCDCG